MGSTVHEKGYFYFPGTAAYIRSDEPVERVAGRLEAARPGDLLLIRTPGPVYAIGRGITRNLYDHVAVVLDGGRTLNIVYPKTVILPATHFARPGRRPLILRPAWRQRSQQVAFVSGLEERFAESAYNLRKTILGIAASMIYGWFGIPLAQRKPGAATAKWICTEAILAELVRCMPDFAAIDRLKLDYNTVGFATTNDFLRICIAYPQLLRVADFNGIITR